MTSILQDLAGVFFLVGGVGVSIREEMGEG
jgi:hypothetical protein